ncbi:DUF3565 domain-containing protein [Aquipseudomonas ullengensis]|uniref:DUF3565 domain-containing protein n=1 Tax=Aquipseudomonas ullengensis TaxID=2759166 RepID=UPI001F348512|nr:DUF3565 domain-containing protein [Pseudomonas ullengensis]
MQKIEEPASLPAASVESDPNPDKRAIPTCLLVGFHQDEDGHWVADLSCGHTQHLRHQPPWQNRAWVMDVQQRQQRIGQPFACGWCAAEQREHATNSAQSR